MTAHAATINLDDVVVIIFWVWLIGGSVAGTTWEAVRRARRRRRLEKAAAVRHRREVELALARHGQLLPTSTGAIVVPPAEAAKGKGGKGKGGKAEADVSGWQAPAWPKITAVPAAVIPSPPSAKPLLPVPGECRHERIVPAITGDGDVVAWLCANAPRCEAQFPPGIAVYAPAADAYEPEADA